MNRRELQESMERLAEERKFRWLDKTKRYVGIHRGIVMEILEWDGEVTFKFSSPTVSIGDEAVKNFEGFSRCAEGGLPANWISHLMETDDRGGERVSKQGCAVSIDGHRIDAIGEKTFAQIPDLVAEDLHAHGASETLLCLSCGRTQASTVALLNNAYTPMCDGCWQDFQVHAKGDKLAIEQSVNWLLVVPLLVVLTVIGALIWGLLQHPERLDNFGFFSMLLPAAWAFGLCWIISLVCSGVTRMLRLSLLASVVITVLAGNIWGYRAFVIQQMEKQFNQPVIGPGWIGSIQLYFLALPEIWQEEVPFLVGGVLGAWIGLRYLKRHETITVE